MVANGAPPQITDHVTEQHGERDEKEAKCPACKDVLNFAGDAQMFEDHYRDDHGQNHVRNEAVLNLVQ